MRRIQLTFILISILLLSCCGTATADEYPVIVCTSFPCYDFARAVVGEEGNVQMLIKPGAEVHSYEPTPADIMAIAQCDLFIYIGGESDVWVNDILASFGPDAPKTLRLFDCVEAIEVEHDHAHQDADEYDEHIWTSPVNAMLMVQAIADELCIAYESNAENYRTNADYYCAQISELDEEFREITANGVRRELVFADRFPLLYFACEYGLTYTSAFPNCSAESEPSARTIMDLIEKVRGEEIPVVYILELSNGKTAQTIAEESGAEVLTFYSVQNISEADFAAGETYVSLMHRNINALQEGLN